MGYGNGIQHHRAVRPSPCPCGPALDQPQTPTAPVARKAARAEQRKAGSRPRQGSQGDATAGASHEPGTGHSIRPGDPVSHWGAPSRWLESTRGRRPRPTRERSRAKVGQPVRLAPRVRAVRLPQLCNSPSRANRRRPLHVTRPGACQHAAWAARPHRVTGLTRLPAPAPQVGDVRPRATGLAQWSIGVQTDQELI